MQRLFVCPQTDAVHQANGYDRLSLIVSNPTRLCSPQRAGDQGVDRFPADLLADRTSSDQAGLRKAVGDQDTAWWLAHTRPRQEKAVANDFLARRISFYLPLVARKAITRGRRRRVLIPLFSGYVFFYGCEADRLSALKTNRLLTIQQVSDGSCLRRQLRSISQLIAAGAPLVREERLAAGERVRIKTGIFRGIEGVILRRHGKTELLVAIDFLGQGVSIEIEDCIAEPV